MDRFAIVNVLKTNNLFGQSKRIEIDVDTESLKTSMQTYNDKVSSVDKSFSQFASKNMTGGSHSDAINELGRGRRETIERISRRVDDDIRIDRHVATAVNSIMSGSRNVIVDSMPNGMQRVVRSLQAS